MLFHRPLYALGPLDPHARPTEVGDDVLGGVQDGGILRTAVTLFDVAAVVANEEQHTVEGERTGGTADDRRSLRPGTCR